MAENLINHSESFNDLYEDNIVFNVINRKGEKEELDPTKIKNRIINLIKKEPKIEHIDVNRFMIDISSKLKNNIKTSEIDEYSSIYAASHSINNPNYLQLAGRIAIDNHHKLTVNSFVDKINLAFKNNIIDPTFYYFVNEHKLFIEKLIDYEKDFLLDYFGMKTFQKQYSIKINDVPIERPQDMFMRTAIALNYKSIDDIVINFINYIHDDNYDITKYLEIRCELFEEYFDITENELEILIQIVKSIYNSCGTALASDKYTFEELIKNISKEQFDENVIRKLYDEKIFYFIFSEILSIENQIKDTYMLLSNKLYTHASPTYYNAGGLNQQFASCFLLGSEDSLEGIMKSNYDMAKISKWAGGIGIHIHNWRSKNSKIKSTGGNSSGIIPFIKITESTMKAFNQGGRRPGCAKIYLAMHHPDLMDFIVLRKNDGTDNNRARDLFYALWVPDLFMKRLSEDGNWRLFDPNECTDLSNYYGEEYESKYLELESQNKFKISLKAREIWKLICEVNAETGMPDILFSDNINKYNMQSNIGVIKSSNLCNEIVQYSDHKQYATCILASIALPNFVFDTYDSEELKKIKYMKEGCSYCNNSDKYKNIEDLKYGDYEKCDNCDILYNGNQVRKLNHTFPVNPIFDFIKLINVVKIIVRNLNNLIDRNKYPVKESEYASKMQRAIGIGVQGLDDTYSKLRFSFDSPKAFELNKKIFECIYYAALSASCELSREKYINKIKTNKLYSGLYSKLYSKLKDNNIGHVYKRPDIELLIDEINNYKINKDHFAYPFYKGSPISEGKFHWEMYNASVSGMFDWESLKEKIKCFGVLNSMLVALMPTASTSQLLGNNECFEPYTSNLYVRSTSAGNFPVIKKYLINDLYNLRLWSKELKDIIISTEGSIQNIEIIPKELRDLYKTAWELDQSVLIQQAIDRQPFVDQAQSMNLWLSDVSMVKFSKCLIQGWKGGLKTGKYYLHTRASVSPTKFTISPALQKIAENVQKQLNDQKSNNQQLNDQQLNNQQLNDQQLNNYCDGCAC